MDLKGGIMAKPKKSKSEEVEELRKRDAYALALLIYDIYQDYKRREKKDGASIRRKSR
jgi:hypothetical protein